MAVKRKKRPNDPLARAKLIGDIATGQTADIEQDDKNPHAVELGRLGGLKGGKARTLKLSPEERRKFARHAARARWAAKTSSDK
jgi:hypothetical protein